MRRMAQERTYVMLKPGVIQRRLVGEALGRIEAKGLKIIGLKLMQIPRSLAETHYGEHRERPFFGDLVSFITSSPVVVGVVEGPNAVSITRGLVGATNPADAAAGTIRGDFGLTIGMNIIHASDAVESGKREISLFFDDGEIVDYSRDIERWIVE